MSFKLSPPFKKNPTPIVNMPLEEDVMGRADKKREYFVKSRDD